jgi:DNA/RNA-binding domain of Phe-tRNA-synthetase-like protein
MNFKISSEIFEKFPDLQIGLVVVKGINDEGESKEILELIHNKELKIKANFDKSKLSEEEKISVWRKAYSSFGAKPKKYKCSVENLYRMILDDISLKHINKIVDIYNYISIKHMVPVGGDDIDKVSGDITLGLASGSEKFVELGSTEVKSPREGEVIYSDSEEVLCRRWNWRECDKSKMSVDTTNVALVIEGLGVEVSEIAEELKELVVKYCGGEAEVYLLSKENKEVEFEF